jgi:hypothetical protein
MADTDIDAVRKQKKAERIKQYRLKRKVILHTRYVSTCVGAGGGRGRGTKIKQKQTAVAHVI